MQIREVLKSLVSEERKLNIQILKFLMEIDDKKLYLDWGFGSLFSYVTQELLYSEASASRRISAMRLLRQDKLVEEKLEAGALSLSNAAQVHTILKQIKSPTNLDRAQLISAAENKSTREAEKALLKAAQKIDPKFIPPVRETLRAESGETLSLKISISQELESKLQRLKQLLSNKNPHLSYAELLEILADRALKGLDPMDKKPREKSAPAPGQAKEVSKNSRFIAAAVRRQVWRDSQGNCTYIDPNSQRRCDSRHLLEIDHILPLAHGGSSNLKNLRILCRAHNQRTAEQMGILDGRRPKSENEKLNSAP